MSREILWLFPIIVVTLACISVYVRWKAMKGPVYARSLALSLWAILIAGITLIHHFSHF